MPTPPDNDQVNEHSLLAEGRALRALARSLLGPEQADDVVQDGYATALAAPVVARRKLGPWLSGTVRNLAAMVRRAETRRRRRERLVARDEVDAGSDPAVIAARAEVIHEVAAAVRALDEPFRTVVVLRFWHGLLPEAIAQQLGVPRNTVRSRLQRGLERLRARLDGVHGSRERWSAALLEFAGGNDTVAVSGAVTWGGFLLGVGLLMKTKLFVTAAALLITTLSISWLLNETEASPAVAAAQAPSAQPVAAAVDKPPEPAIEPAREAPAPRPVEPSAEVPFDPSPVRVTPWLARFLVLDDDDRSVRGAVVTIWAAKRAKLDADMLHRLGGQPKDNTYSGHEPDPLFELLTDAEGRASATLDLECLAAAAHKEESKTGETQLWHTRDNARETKLMLVAPLVLRGRVMRSDGSPAAGAKVTSRVNGFNGVGRGRPPEPEPVLADADGHFAVRVVHQGGYDLSAELGGQGSFLEHCWIRTRTPPEVVLVFPGAITLNGSVVDAEGKPVDKADVRIWREYRWGDPNQRGDDYERAFAKSGPDGRFSVAVRQHRRYQLIASADGHATSNPVWVEPTAARPRVEVQLALQRFTTIGGVVRHGDGKPFGAVKVRARLHDPHDGAVAVPSQSDLYQDSTTSVSDDDGRFELTVHPGTNWTIVAFPYPNNRNMAVVTKDVRPGMKDLAIVIGDQDLQGCIVRGEVMTSVGAPLTTFEIDLVVLEEGRPARFGGSIEAVVTGNRFELPLLPLGRTFALDVFPTDGRKQNVRPRYPGSFAPVRIAPFQTTREAVDLSVRVEAWGEQPVHVLAPDGTPARNVVVMAIGVPRLEVTMPGRRLDTQGRITLQRCVPGVNKLVLFRDDNRVHEQDVTILPGLNPEVVVRLPAQSPASTGR